MIYLDTCLLIYAVEQHPAWSAPLQAAMAAVPDGRFAVSPLVTMECMVRPMKDGNLALQKRYRTALALLLQLPLPEQVFLQAAQLRAHFGLKTPDALHLACAQHHGCSALWTNDDRLAQAGHGLAMNALRA